MEAEIFDGLSFHHIGYATNSIEQESKMFMSLGYAQSGEIFTDTTQMIRGCFLVSRGEINAPSIELLENLRVSGGGRKNASEFLVRSRGKNVSCCIRNDGYFFNR